MQIQFKVSMDNEQKLAKNFKPVVLEVSFEGVPTDLVQKAALAHAVVAWQHQIRSHWTEFVDGKLPKEITFGNPLFTPKRGTTAPMTQESVLTYMKGLAPEDLAKMVAKMQE
jgi:hypothetical protein